MPEEEEKKYNIDKVEVVDKITASFFQPGSYFKDVKPPEMVKGDFSFFATKMIRDPDIVKLEREFQAIQDNYLNRKGLEEDFVVMKKDSE